MSSAKVVSLEMLLTVWSRGDAARVLPPGEVVEAHSLAAEAADQFVPVPAAQIRDGADADIGKRALAGLAQAPR